MQCDNCKCEVRVNSSDEGTSSYEPLDTTWRDLIRKYNIPFYCTLCGNLDFKYQATGDKVFVWPEVTPDKVGSIYIPVVAKKTTGYGLVLSVGPGTVSKSKKSYVPTTLKAGERVAYDNSVPWGVELAGSDGKIYFVRIMGELDVFGYAPEEENT
jgi:co-chaperonin GroES (HSP10)